jgi:hypothetical protein
MSLREVEAENFCLIEITYRHRGGSLSFQEELSDPRPMDFLLDLVKEGVNYDERGARLAKLEEIAASYGNRIETIAERNQVPFFLFKSFVTLILADNAKSSATENLEPLIDQNLLFQNVTRARDLFWSGHVDDRRGQEIQEIFGSLIQLLKFTRYLLVYGRMQYIYFLCHDFQQGMSILQSACKGRDIQLRLVEDLPVW